MPFLNLRQISLLFFLPSACFAVDVTLEWNPNPEPDIIGYRIYYASFPGGSLQQMDTGKQTRAVLSGLPSGKNWIAVATARNAFGLESAPSDLVFFDSNLVTAAKVQSIFPMSVSPASAGASTIPTFPAEQETNGEKQPDAGLVGNSDYQFEAPTTDPPSAPPPEVSTENNFLMVISPPQSQSVFTGDTVVLKVTAVATGPVSWQWLHNGKPLPDADSSTLNLGPASPAETGSYQVRIIMGEKETLTDSAVVSVWPRPTLTISPGPNRLNPVENGLEILVSGGSLQPLSLEFSENLTHWSQLEAFRLNDQGTRTILDPKAAQQRFYRLRAGE